MIQERAPIPHPIQVHFLKIPVFRKYIRSQHANEPGKSLMQAAPVHASLSAKPAA